MNQTDTYFRFLLGFAALIIVIAGIKSAQELVNPFLLAIFFAIVLSAPMNWLHKKGLPDGLAATLVIVAAVTIFVLFLGFISDSLAHFNDQLSHYQTKFAQQWEQFNNFIPFLSNEALNSLQPSHIMKLVSQFMGGLTSGLKNFFLIFFTVVLMLLESRHFIDKFPKGDTLNSESIKQFTSSIRSYLGLKTVASLMTGIAVVLLLFVLGVDFPLLWGVLAFLLNYIPNIGSLIAAVPAVILAWVQLGMGQAGVVAGGYIIINLIIGSIIEPKIMGKGMGLSVLVVFLSLFFWGWILGIIGMLLSVPLTLALKLLLEQNPHTAKWGALLSAKDD